MISGVGRASALLFLWKRQKDGQILCSLEKTVRLSLSLFWILPGLLSSDNLEKITMGDEETDSSKE